VYAHTYKRGARTHARTHFLEAFIAKTKLRIDINTGY